MRRHGMDHDHHDWSPLVDRPVLRWPGDARVALCVIVTLEHLEWQPPEGWFQPAGLYPRPLPDYTTFSHRDYGHRVGIYRLLDLLGRHAIPATIAADTATLAHYPALVSHCLERGCEFIGHGASASRMITSRMSEAEERAYIGTCVDAHARMLGTVPKGWLGPQYGESARTPALIAEAGVRFLCDWVNDEQPYRMTTPSGDLYALPVTLDLDDDFAFRQRHHQVDVFARMLCDAFDGLHAEGGTSGRLLVLNLHPWQSGQPFRVRFLDSAFGHITGHSGVWAARGGDIIDWFGRWSAAGRP